MNDPLELTSLLRRAGEDPAAGEAVLPRVYEELRRLASAQMGREPSGHTLQATALVHEAWIKLVGDDGQSLSWDNRAHFFSAAGRAMRQILVDRARRVRSEKHGGLLRRQPLENVDVDVAFDPDQVDFIALDSALSKLEARDPRAARIVELRFFAGLAVEDTASVVGVSERTVAREWNLARAWLSREVGQAGG